jgi:hypothetical protein
MLENASTRMRLMVYGLIALLVTFGLSLYHYFLLGWQFFLVLIAAVIEFFLVFYIFYLPLKYKRKQE